MNLSNIAFAMRSFRDSPCGFRIAQFCAVSAIVLAAAIVYGVVWAAYFVLFYFTFDADLVGQIFLSMLIAILTILAAILAIGALVFVYDCMISACKDTMNAIRETKQKINSDLEARNNPQECDLNNLGGANDAELGL